MTLLSVTSSVFESHPFKVSVLTPTWNRAEYLADVWKGLTAQMCQDFEWIVGNDGSEDNTVEVVRTLAAESHFPVTLINASARVGKSRIDNQLVKTARGEFIIWCDSDDILLPNALETLLATWDSILDEERDRFCGVTALCESEGRPLGSSYPKAPANDLGFNTLLYMMKSDLVIFTRAELLKVTPFLEVDYLISESSVWNQIGVRQTRFIPEVLEKKRYGEKHCLSWSGKMRYNRGHAHALALTESAARLQTMGAAQRLRRTVNYGRYCVHGDLPFLKAAALWSEYEGSRLALALLYPVSVLLAAKDRFQGKVEKTHLAFEEGRRNAKISVEYLGGTRATEVIPPVRVG